MSFFNRARPLAIGLCVALMPMAHHAFAGESVRAAQQPAGEQQIPTNKEELDAVEVARTALGRALYVSPETLPVLSIEKGSWPNSGLGCASPDTATINIGRRGYAVALATPEGVRHVHVAGRQSRVCDPPSKPESAAIQTTEVVVAPPLPYDLNAVVKRSREDLARRLKTPVNSVRLISFASKTWPDNTMDCAVPYEQARKKAVKGYRIQLGKGERVYIYHTDLVRTRACPSLDTPTVAANVQLSDTPAPAKPAVRRSAPAKKKIADAGASPSYLGIVQRYPSP